MQFNVAQLLKQSTGATRTYEISEEIEGLDPELVPLSPLTGALKLLRTHSGVLVTGDLDVTLEVVCNRCLEPVPQQVNIILEESFRPLTDVETGRFIMLDEFEGQEEELIDGALLIDDHHILDASEVIRQNIWLSSPMVPGCAYMNPEQCPHFAARMAEVINLDDEASASLEETIDPRWAALLALQQSGEEDK
jgi:uncharacterized protein